MADFHLPNARLEMPELLIPGRKPIGPVVIDWEHPIAAGLAEFTLVNGVGAIINLVHNNGTSTVVEAGVLSSAVSQNGRCVYRNYTLNTTSEGKLSVPMPTLSSGNYTLMGFIEADSTTDENCIMDDDGSPRIFQFRVNIGGAVAFIGFYGGSNQSMTTGAIPAAELKKGLFAAATVSTTETCRVWANSSTSTMVARAWNVPFTSNTVSLLNRKGSGGVPSDGRVFFTAAWDRTLSVSEVESMRANPYQFLVPA